MLAINEIYLTFNGEVNPYGIGSPTIFVRTQGCHLRCYKSTLGVLCDTPNALEHPKKMLTNTFHETGGFLEDHEWKNKLLDLRESTGVNLICLTGGDPLWRRKESLWSFFDWTADNNFLVTVETSGTIDWEDYLHYKNVSWIVDYKLKSAGVKAKSVLDKEGVWRLCQCTSKDYVKFVAYDQEDLDEILDAFKRWEAYLGSDIYSQTNFAVGPYWGGKLKIWQIFKWAESNSLLGKITMNFQTHKLMQVYDLSDVNSIDQNAQI